MLSRSMGTEMISLPAFYDELEKIAEEQDRWITKEKLKRHAKTLAAVGAGAGLGYGTGKLVRRYVRGPGMKHLWKLSPKWQERIKKYSPAAATIVGGAGVLAASKLRRKADKYVEKGDERNAK